MYVKRADKPPSMVQKKDLAILFLGYSVKEMLICSLILLVNVQDTEIVLLWVCHKKWVNVMLIGQVLVIEDGGCFGELALMYNAPRAATITAVTKSKVRFANIEITFNALT